MLDVIRVWKVTNYPFPICSLLFLFLVKFLHPCYNWIFMKNKLFMAFGLNNMCRKQIRFIFECQICTFHWMLRCKINPSLLSIATVINAAIKFQAWILRCSWNFCFIPSFIFKVESMFTMIDACLLLPFNHFYLGNIHA